MIKRNKLLLVGMFFSFLMAISFTSCSSDDIGNQTFPLSADIFNSVDGRQVAFQGLTHGATSWSWDFGDGQTSTEQNPVHIYENGGYYVAVLTATDKTGATMVAQVNLAVDLTPYILLTGGPTATNGKTWKLSPSHAGHGDYFALATPNLDPFDQTPNPLPDGALNLFLDMPEVYQQEFTFYFDGGYEINLDGSNGTAYSGLIFQLFKNGGVDIVNTGGQDFGLCTAKYVPDTDETFTYMAKEDFTIPSAITQGPVTYSGVSTIDFSGNGYLVFLDYQRKVIIQEITDSTMRIVVFASLDPGAAQAGGYSTHGMVLTLEVVN